MHHHHANRVRLEDFILDNMIEDAANVDTYFVWLTPEMAAFLLERNTKNRPVTSRWVESLCKVIANGEWELNGEAIVVSDTGKLIQGQHRCLAVVQSGREIPTLIVVGVSDRAFATFDMGRKRSASDVFAIDGEVNTHAEAAITRALFLYEKTGDPFSSSHAVQPSAKELLAFLRARPEIKEITHWAVSASWCRKHVAISIAGFCRHVFANRDADACAEFFQMLETGIGLKAGSPVLLLRERLIDATSSKNKITPRYKTALIFKAFRLFVKGSQVKNLIVRTEGPQVEKDLFVL